MAKVTVVCDSVACMPRDLAAERNIKIVPSANIYFNGSVYIDGETITPAEAYELIEKDPDRFMTAALTPDYLLEKYAELAVEGNEIFLITLSGALSAFNRVAGLAAETFKEKHPDINIRVYDSRSAGPAEGLVVLEAARAAAEGKSLDEIAAVADAAREKTGGLMLFDTLRYVYRTGRMSKMASRIASLFNIRPVSQITPEGKLEMVDKVRKRQDGLDMLLDIIEKQSGTKSLHFMISHSAAPDVAEYFANMLKEKFECLSIIISDYSPVMGYSTGKGTVFVGFHPELNLHG